MKQYLELLKDVLENGVEVGDRTGVGVRKVFSRQLRFNLQEGFPLVTSKKVHLKSVIHELLWFLKGDTNVKYLNDNGVSIWNAWADENGDLGSIYGKQWVAWETVYENIRPVLKEYKKPEIISPYKKEINLDFSSNHKGYIGKRISSKTGDYTITREHKVFKDGVNTYLYDVKYINTGYELVKKTYPAVISGNIKDNYYPSAVGVGCQGEEVSREDKDLLYQTWIGILKRCYDKNHMGYSNYGGRNIFVCDRWLIFSNFVEDVKKLPRWIMKKEYPEEFSLDKDFYSSNTYSPTSCIWLSKKEQNLNNDAVSLIKATNPKGISHVRMGVRTICEEFNLLPICVGNCLKGKQKTHHGWTFEYINDNKNHKILITNQIKTAVAKIKHNPYDRGMIINAWNVGQLHEMRLRPCHYSYQFDVCPLSKEERILYPGKENKLNLSFSMRSSDVFLGLPFNIASYALLNMMMAQVTNCVPGELVYSGVDVHIYNNHVYQVKEQLSREPRTLPTMKINPHVKDIFSFKYEDFQLEGYEPWPAIKAPVAV